MRITIAGKIEAQRKLVKELGGDWYGMTQKQLDEFWKANCSRYVLTYVKGEGPKYIPFEDVSVHERMQ